MGFVPSERWEYGAAALDSLLPGVHSVSVAVAFVSDAGIEILGELLRKHQIEDAELVARGAPITDPDALERAQDDFGISVSAITGPAALTFHPKL